MLLFSCNEPRVIIPLNRVYNIVSSGCSIYIYYEAGDIQEISKGKWVEKTECEKITFDSPDQVDKVIRQFYKACNANSNAFYFGIQK